MADNKDILKYIEGYSRPEPPQSIENIRGDFQLTGLMPLLKNIISKIPGIRILDIGCGKGVLVAKLKEANFFNTNNDFDYYGFDFAEKISEAFSYAASNSLLDRVQFKPLNKWFEFVQDPCLVVIRNVFHELSLRDGSKLIYEICEHLPLNSHLIIQDLTTLPISEKGNAGWIGLHLEEVFSKGGFKINFSPDTSKSGIDVFILEGEKNSPSSLSEREFYNLLIDLRRKQLQLLTDKYNSLEENTKHSLMIARLSHDIAAITSELMQNNAIVSQKEQGVFDDYRTMVYALKYALTKLKHETILQLKVEFEYPTIPWFQNRSHCIQAMDDFLRKDKRVFLLLGGILMGKRTVIWEVLSRIEHDRYPLYFDLSQNFNIVRFFEEILTHFKLNIYIDLNVLSNIRKISKERLFKLFSDSLPEIVPQTILILNDFEMILTPDNEIENEDLKWIIDVWVNTPKSKLIIESRFEIKNAPFSEVYIEYLTHFRSVPEKKFGKHRYTVQLLQKIVPLKYRLSQEDYGGFPLKLLEIIENHPHFACMAANMIKNNPNTSCLEDFSFINDIKHSFYKNILSNFNLSEEEMKLIRILKLVNCPLPIELIEHLGVDKEVFVKLYKKGLVRKAMHNKFSLMAILKDSSNFDISGFEDVQELSELHQRLSEAFRNLYDIFMVPVYYRQYYYHSLLALPKQKRNLKPYHITEIEDCASDWFKLKDYDSTLWAITEIEKNYKLTSRQKMRKASCLIRMNKVNNGMQIYKTLFNKFPTWTNVKHSCVDSLIYNGTDVKIREAISILMEIKEDERSGYWHLQYARALRHLNSRKESIEQYEEAILNSSTTDAWNFVKELCNYAREMGDSYKEKEWLEDYVWDSLHYRTSEVKIELGALYERLGRLDEAKMLLLEAYDDFPNNPYCTLALIKTLCRNGEFPRVEKILVHSSKSTSKRKNEILKSAKVFYLKSIEQFDKGAAILQDLIWTGENPIHYWGQWAELHLLWLKTCVDESNKLAKIGLKYLDDILESNNVPALIPCRYLAQILEDSKLQNKIEDKIREINDAISFDGESDDLSF